MGTATKSANRQRPEPGHEHGTGSAPGSQYAIEGVGGPPPLRRASSGAVVGPLELRFALGDYETASFATMNAVEVEVRRVAGLPNELLGVALMRKAFSPKDGALRDPSAEGGDQSVRAKGV